MKNPWKTISSKIVYKTPWMSVQEDKVIRPDKKKGIYAFTKIGKTVGVVAVTAKKEIFLVKEYRYPLKKTTIEIPRGNSEDSESALQSAKKELLEEAGVTAKKWIKLGCVNMSPGILDENIHMYLATNLTIGQPQPEDVEKQEVVRIPFRRAYQWCLTGRINDALTLSAILRAKKQLKI